jgi:membrane protease YdiL (CAAX protease family)
MCHAAGTSDMAEVPLSAYRPVPGRGRRWAGLQFPLTRLVLALVPIAGVVTVAQLGALAAAERFGLPRAGLAMALLLLAAAAPAPLLYVGYVRLVERRRVVELGTDHLVRDLGTGFALGLGLCTTTVIALLLIGVARIELDAGIGALVPALLCALAAALAEEVLFRGVMFRILEERLGSWIALAISAAVFGTLHLFNEHADAAAAIAIALEAGVLLAAAYMYARRLWLPIAIHAGWNFSELGIYGVPGSGPAGHGFWVTHFTGPTILTGGGYGPDVSIVAVLVCLALATSFLVLARRRGHIVRPFYARSNSAAPP